MPEDDRDTLPLIPIREETGLPPPPEWGQACAATISSACVAAKGR